MVSIANAPRGALRDTSQEATKQSNATSPLEGASTRTSSQSTDVRRNLMRVAHTEPSTTPNIDLAPLKARIADLVQHEAYRGLPEEKRSQLMEQQLGKLSKLPETQQAELRAEFIRLDKETAERREQELQATMQRLVQETSNGSFNEQALKSAYQELARVAGKGTSKEEWSAIRADFENQRNDLRRSAMIREIRQLGRSSVTLGESLDRDKTSQAVAKIQQRYADVALSGKEVTSHLKSSYEAEYQTKLAKAGFFSRQYYKASRWLDETGDWLARSFDRATQAAGSAFASVKAFGESALQTGSAALSELADAGKGIARLFNEGLDAALAIRERAIEGLQSAGTAIGEFAYEVVTDPKAAMTKVVNGAIAIKDGVLSAHAWAVEKIANGLLWAADTYQSAKAWIKENGTELLKATGEMMLNVGAGIVEGGWATLQTGWNLVKVTLGQMTWQDFTTATAHAFSGALKHLSVAGSIAWAGVSTAGGVLKDLSDSIGLTDLVVGIGHSSIMIPHLLVDLGMCAIGKQTLSGAFSNAGHHISESARAVVGAVKCVGEVTGITDAIIAGTHLVHALAAYGRGNDTEALKHLGTAALHGTFAVMSAGALAATVATGGAAVGSMAAVVTGRMAMKQAAKAVLKTAAKEFFEKGAKEIGELAVQKLGSNALSLVSKEMGSTAVKELKQQALRELGSGATKEATTAMMERLALQKVIQREGVATAKELGEGLSKKASSEFTTDTVQHLGQEIGERRTAALLEKLQLSESVDELVYDALTQINSMSPRQARAHLKNTFRLSDREAGRMARETKKALKSGKADDAIKQLYEDGITKHITEVIQTDMEVSFKETFGKALRGQLDEPWSKTLAKNVDEQAKALGKNVDEFADELVEAGWKGVKEGIEAATRKAVRKGIESAFKRFRARSAKVVPSADGEKDLEKVATVEASEELVERDAEVLKTSTPEPEDQLRQGESLPTRQFTINQSDGTTLVVTEVLDIATNKWVQTGRETLGAKVSLRKEEPPKMKEDYSKTLAA